MIYTIGEMATLLHVAPSTLRYYDKEGLLPFVERSSAGIRVFQDKDIEWLNIIECLKKTGMSIKEIKLFIDWCMEGDSTIEQRKRLIQKQREVVQQQMNELQETMDMLDYKTWYYETAEKAGTCAIHDTITEDEVPEQYRKARNKSKALVETMKS